MDREALRRAQQASRSAFLRKEAQRQEKAAASVLQEKLKEIEQGVVPSTLSEAEFLLQRSKEVKAAEGLLQAARHRQQLAGEVVRDDTGIDESIAGSLPGRSGVEAVVEETLLEQHLLRHPSTAAEASKGQGEPRGTSTAGDAASRPDGFVEMEAHVVEERVAKKDYVVEKTIEELQQEKAASLLSQHERLQAQRRSLPIYQVRDELLQTIRANQAVVIVGETGSGKTTQLLQFLYEDGLHLRRRPTDASLSGGGSTTPPVAAETAPGVEEEEEELRLVCTQPRRIAAVSVAERVAQELGCRCGSVVGYRVRFDDKSGPLTRILYVTDGMMLKEFTSDPDLSSVAAIMVDEAHERSLNTDILLGLLRDIVRRNPRIKVIVASATINADKFSRFFDNAPVFTVKGRTYPVETFYTEEPVADYITESAQTVLGLHLSKPLPGDILVFLPGQDTIEACAETLRQYVAESQGQMRPMLILPIYAALPPKEQARIYERTPPGTRKVVIATNIAETSITIDGVVYVVDCGLCKQDFYNPRAMVEELRVVPTSQASATQRTGRAGRTQPGECFRLYTAYTFRNELPAETVPEILRCSMSAVVLQLKVLGIHNLLQFDFLDNPSTDSLERALDHLFLLGAMKPDGRLTVTGRRMAEFPMDPSLSKCLIKACALGCGRHMAMAAAMLTLDSIFLTTRDTRERQQTKSARDHLFAFGNGDVAGYVALLEAWLRTGGSSSADFCLAHGIHPRTMLRARDVLDQILKIFDRIGLDLNADGAHTATSGSGVNDDVENDGLSKAAAAAGRLIDVEALTKSLLSGFFFNVSKLEADKRTYRIVRPMDTGAAHTAPQSAHAYDGDDAPTAEIHPSSYLFRAGQKGAGEVVGGGGGGAVPPILRERPALVVFTQLRRTTKRFMINLCAIPSPDWVLNMAPVNYFRKEELETGLRKRPRE